MINVQWDQSCCRICYDADELDAAKVVATNNNLLVDWTQAKSLLSLKAAKGNYEYMCAPIVGLVNWVW